MSAPEKTLPRPDLPSHHPQNVPLSRWRDGWLALSVAGHTDDTYVISTPEERQSRGWPVTREERIALLVERGDIPAAGV